ncbi:MAG: hypothetical protein PVF23_05415 [Chromatiales bacterium]|jgi:hypothetical protein
MRWIFFLLLVGNLLLLMLILQSDEGEKAGLPAIGELEVFPVTDGSAPVEDAPNVVVSEAGEGMRCLRVGPFETRERAATLTAEVTRLGHASTITSQSPKLVTDFHVLQTPEVTGEHLEDDLARLQRAGMTDASPIGEGEYSGGISLGIFELRANAIERRQEVDRYGLTAEIVERTSEKALLWVDIYQSPGKKLMPEELESLERRFDLAVTFEDVACP